MCVWEGGGGACVRMYTDDPRVRKCVCGGGGGTKAGTKSPRVHTTLVNRILSLTLAE